MATIKTGSTSSPRKFAISILSFPLWWIEAAKERTSDDIGTEYSAVVNLIAAIAIVFVLFIPAVTFFTGKMNLLQTLLVALVVYFIMGVIYRVIQRIWGMRP